MAGYIKCVNRAASTAFAPDGAYIAAGTMAGAVDLQFSSSANLDLFELDFVSDDQQLIPVGTVPSSERFNRLSWEKGPANSEEYSLGLISGGLVDGNIGIWNPRLLIRGLLMLVIKLGLWEFLHILLRLAFLDKAYLRSWNLLHHLEDLYQ